MEYGWNSFERENACRLKNFCTIKLFILKLFHSRLMTQLSLHFTKRSMVWQHWMTLLSKALSIRTRSIAHFFKFIQIFAIKLAPYGLTTEDLTRRPKANVLKPFLPSLPRNKLECFVNSAQLMLCFQILGAAGGEKIIAGNTKGGSITVPLTSCLSGLD
jgi:hypothetical protein